MKKRVKFTDLIALQQISWKKNNICDLRKQTWTNGIEYDHLLPKDIWDQGIWVGVRQGTLEYIKKEEIKPHPMKHSLRSSWTLCVNLYFAVKMYACFKDLMLLFLRDHLDINILSIDDLALEFAFPEGDELSQVSLLGEEGGGRGTGQTSPDVALFVTTDKGPGLILIECKYTEHSFYACSARRSDEKGNKSVNPDPQRCMQKADLTCYRDICHQIEWGRQYLNILKFSDYGIRSLNNCPAATNGYQMLRQQAFAEGIANSGRYTYVINSVAYDRENNTLINSLARTGIKDWTKDWGKNFKGKTEFLSFSHQEWVKFVRDNQINNLCQDWLSYVHERYQY